VAGLPYLVAVVDEAFCRDVADHFERLPRLTFDDGVARGYERLKHETRLQYEAVLAAGIAVEPWLGRGQPYRDATEMARRVHATRTLHVFLTRDGHGPPGSVGFHPMREPSGVVVDGVEFTHNDLFRAVHDLFGHVAFGNTFGAAGELKAAYCQMALLPETARPIVLTEQVAQTCWFFFGPHLRDEAGRVRRPRTDGYVPPHRRPYPEQKVFLLDSSYLDRFQRMFHMEGPS
jgi:hypothetical protein